jgi:hypothetical protein
LEYLADSIKDKEVDGIEKIKFDKSFSKEVFGNSPLDFEGYSKIRCTIE